MDQILKSIRGINVTHLLVVSILMIANVSTAQATVVSYNVTGVIFEPQTQPTNTTFNGSFEWDGLLISNLRGTMNSSMWETDDINPDPDSLIFPLIHLDYQLAQSANGNIVTASVFKENTTDVFRGGGYETGDSVRYGEMYIDEDGNLITDQEPNDNAYFTFSFDKTTMTGLVDSLVYGDCTPGGMMGVTCMTGHNLPGGGSMGAFPLSIEISAVPVPAAVWLFGTALVGMIGVTRKRDLQA